MQRLRGTKDILPDESIFWQHIQNTASKLLTLASYHEIRTPIIESTSLFKRSIGNGTDIVNKEMYSFTDQGSRNITLRPEGTASIARSFINNNLHKDNTVKRLWYLGPMFRYERPQNGRQRQFHQLGIECIGSLNPMADVEVIRIATNILNSLNFSEYTVEINSIGTSEEREKYKEKLIRYLTPYINDLDHHARSKLITNPLKILDSKNIKTKEILNNGPSLYDCLEKSSKKHFQEVCDYLECLDIEYTINDKLVRGLDYYNYTAFEIKTKKLGSQDTICGGGRYDSLIKQLGGPNIPSVGWAIGVERLLLIIKDKTQIELQKPKIYIVSEGTKACKRILKIIPLLEKNNISYNLDLNNSNLQKKLKKANKLGAKICIILCDYEIQHNCITIKTLKNGSQEQISILDTNKLIDKIISET
uniref:Histidine--tRNA ligase, chloroplastic n=1 Tax=Caulacanthus okamurae TaxID=152008 RepID=A0A6H1UAA2_9FLOR|nr:histidine tRNA synthetase [Caulacanthus okamurae]QIZ74609.1 histidine tRNA synthetase [Caulacanthus okamurae]